MKMDPQYSWIIEIARLSRRGLRAILRSNSPNQRDSQVFLRKLVGDSEFSWNFTQKIIRAKIPGKDTVDRKELRNFQHQNDAGGTTTNTGASKEAVLSKNHFIYVQMEISC